MDGPPLKKVKLDKHSILLPTGEFSLETAFSVGLLAYYFKCYSDIGEKINFSFSDEASNEFDYVIGLGGESNESNFNWGTSMPTEFFYTKRIHKRNDKGQKTKLSCIGLIYKQFGRDIIQNIINSTPNQSVELNEGDMKMLFERIYFDFIEVMDSRIRKETKWCYKYNTKHPKEQADFIAERDLKFSVDNWYLDSMVSQMNLPWDVIDENKHKEQFIKAIELTMGVFSRFVRYLVFTHLGGRSYVESKYMNMIHGGNEEIYKTGDPSAMKKILILDKFVSWKEHLHSFEFKTAGLTVGHCLYTIFPDSTNGWRISSVPVSPGSLKSRKALPLEWRGLNDDKLKEVSGIDDVKFVHIQGFIGGGMTLESCLKMALLAVNC